MFVFWGSCENRFLLSYDKKISLLFMLISIFSLLWRIEIFSISLFHIRYNLQMLSVSRMSATTSGSSLTALLRSLCPPSFLVLLRVSVSLLVCLSDNVQIWLLIVASIMIMMMMMIMIMIMMSLVSVSFLGSMNEVGFKRFMAYLDFCLAAEMSFKDKNSAQNKKVLVFWRGVIKKQLFHRKTW